jgi:hypothetical protein
MTPEQIRNSIEARLDSGRYGITMDHIVSTDVRVIVVSFERTGATLTQEQIREALRLPTIHPGRVKAHAEWETERQRRANEATEELRVRLRAEVVTTLRGLVNGRVGMYHNADGEHVNFIALAKVNRFAGYLQAVLDKTTGPLTDEQIDSVVAQEMEHR